MVPRSAVMLNLLCIVLANFSVLASPTCGPTDEPTVGWVQHGGDFSKCDNQGPDQLSRVANVLACEAMAVSRGDVYFNFNFQMTGAGDYKCFTSNACPGRDATVDCWRSYIKRSALTPLSPPSPALPPPLSPHSPALPPPLSPPSTALPPPFPALPRLPPLPSRSRDSSPSPPALPPSPSPSTLPPPPTLAPAPMLQNNVLFFVMDDLRPDLNEAYGQTQVITPNLDAFAKRSLTFERAYVQFSHCSPSRSSFMTGRTPQQTQVYNFVSSFRTVGRDWVTLPQYFKDNGYYVAGGGKLFHPDSSGPPLNNDQPLSWDSYYFPNDPEDKKYACNESTQLYFGVCPSEESADSFFDAQLAAAAMDELVVARDSGKHWFLGVGFERPHRPWNTPREFYDLYPNSGNAPTDIALATNKLGPLHMPEIAWISNKWPCSLERWGACSTLDQTGHFTFSQYEPIPDNLAGLARWGYYASVSFVDSNFGLVMSKLEELNMASNTIVSVIGDHGWHLGEQAEWCKRTNFELGTRIPMMIHAPNYPTSHGKRTEHFAEAVDLYRTLAALAFPASPPIQDSVSGTDLSPIFADPTNPSTAVRAYTFSQMSRCPAEDTLGPFSSCTQTPQAEITWMGYSVRSEQYRYTMWLPFDGDENLAAWSGTDEHEELYSYVDSKMDDFNSFEKVNVASDPMYTVKKAELRAVLTAAFNPPPPPAQTSSKPALIGGIVGALCFLAVLACFLACRKHGRLRWKK